MYLRERVEEFQPDLPSIQLLETADDKFWTEAIKKIISKPWSFKALETMRWTLSSMYLYGQITPETRKKLEDVFAITKWDIEGNYRLGS